MISIAFQFRFIALAVDVINRCGPINESVPSYSQRRQGNTVLAMYIKAKDILPALYY